MIYHIVGGLKMVKDVEKLGEVIQDIISAVPGISRTQLVKLTYLVDREFYKKNKRTMTGVNYEMYFYGPYSKDFELALYTLKQDDTLLEDHDGISYQIYPNKPLQANLNDDEDEIINRVVSNANSEGLLRSAAAIKRFVYLLPEVDQAKPFSMINFNEID